MRDIKVVSHRARLAQIEGHDLHVLCADPPVTWFQTLSVTERVIEPHEQMPSEGTSVYCKPFGKTMK